MSQLEERVRSFGDVSKGNIFQLLRELVEIAENLGIPGSQRKEAVLDALRLAVSLLPDGDAKQELYDMINHVIPDAIDLAVAVANSNAFKSCFGKCC